MGICDSVSKSNISYSNSSFEKEETSIRKDNKLNGSELSNEKIKKSLKKRRSIEKIMNTIMKNQKFLILQIFKKKRKKIR